MSADQPDARTRLTHDTRPIHARDSPELFPAAFRDAMAMFPSGVTIVTTADRSGRQWGFTASAFCSVSLTPPLVLVCLARSADCFPAFCATNSWVINILGDGHTELAKRFATRGADKFSGGEFVRSHDGLPVLRDAAVSLVCQEYDKYPGGDHTILVGEVVEVSLGERESLVHYARGFPSLS